LPSNYLVKSRRTTSQTIKMLLKIITEDKRTVKTNFKDESTLVDLIEVCRQNFQKEPFEFDLMFGYPSKIIKGDLTDTLILLGIKNGEAITLRINAQKKMMYLKLKDFGYQANICLQAVNVDTSDINLAVEICQQIQFSETGLKKQNLVVMRKVIDADNSCLFNAISYLQLGTGASLSNIISPLYYRNLVANAIRSDPTVYLSDMVDESRSPEEYAQWILEPSKWGGEIEMSILALQLQIEIAAVDIQTTKAYIYGEGRGFEQRIYLLYDGIHYDALVMASINSGDGGSPPIIGATASTDCSRVFAPADESVQQAMQLYAKTLHESKKFIDLGGCDLKCNICNVGLKGQAGAREHAKLTGHTNFGQI
jgi:ubiquitin thioesterase OTU1